MSNLTRLHALATAREELGVRLATPLPADDGSAFVRDSDGGIWRMMEYVYPSRTLSEVRNEAQAAEIGRTLGRFHRLGSHIDPRDIQITLPDFHHTPGYLAALDQALDSTGHRAGTASADAQIADALAFVETRRALVRVLDDAMQAGLTRLRVIHGDPKLDNLLFDPTHDRALCLIDLDTVQPGLLHHDIGDCLRSCCNRAGEATDAGIPIQFDLDVCSGILAAYGAETRGLLNTQEVGLIYPCIRLIPFELGLRFLTDHLQGDRYFRVAAPGDNLRKALVQFALVADIERKVESIQAIVAHSFQRGQTAARTTGESWQGNRDARHAI